MHMAWFCRCTRTDKPLRLLRVRLLSHGHVHFKVWNVILPTCQQFSIQCNSLAKKYYLNITFRQLAAVFFSGTFNHWRKEWWPMVTECWVRLYCLTRWELLLVFSFFKQFKPYLAEGSLFGRNIFFLVWLQNIMEPEGQLARWLEFAFEIVHHQSRKHPDAFSCLPCRQCGWESNGQDLVAMAHVHPGDICTTQLEETKLHQPYRLSKLASSLLLMSGKEWTCPANNWCNCGSNWQYRMVSYTDALKKLQASRQSCN